jgi:hypothetical protein
MARDQLFVKIQQRLILEDLYGPVPESPTVVLTPGSQNYRKFFDHRRFRKIL